MTPAWDARGATASIGSANRPSRSPVRPVSEFLVSEFLVSEFLVSEFLVGA